MPIIECRGLTKDYGKFTALNQVNLVIEENKITGLIGRNGAGKTTLLKILAGFTKQTSGEVNVFSMSPFNNLKVSSNMIFIDDHMVFPASLSLPDILYSAKSFYENWNDVLSRRLFDYFNFHPKQRYNGLSKGMKSTFKMIIGLSARCALTIFDEPTNGMDFGARKDFYRALLREYIEFPRSIIISSHLLNEIEDIMEDIILIREGSIHLYMPMADLNNYAVGITGSTQEIQKLAESNEVFFKKSIGKDTMYVVISNLLSDEKLRYAKASGITISPISSTDLCNYLTSKTNGGIDDVFN